MANALPLPCQDPDLDGAAGIAPDGAARSTDRRATLIACTLGSSLVFVLGSIVNVGLPQMQADFAADAAGAQWIVNAYLLPLSALVLIGGALGDHYGRRAAFLAGLGIFAASCLLCAVAWSLPVFLAGRVLEGVGAALIAPASLAILSDAFSGKQRGAAIGTWAGAGAAAGAVAPVAGGLIVDGLGWRWTFVAVLPLVAWAMALAARSIRESRALDGARAPLDWTGAALVSGGLLALTWGLVGLPKRGLDAPVQAALMAGALALAAFLWVERAKGDRAMTPLALFGSRAFSGLSAFTFLLYGALGGLLFLLPYVLIRDAGYSATMAGLAILPFPLIIGAFSRLAGGALTDRFGARAMLTGGAALVAAGFGLLGMVPPEGLNYPRHILPGLLALAFGMALAVAPLTAAVLSSAGQARAGVASGINNAISRVGGLIATAALGFVLVGGADDLLTGFAWAAWAGAGLAAMAGAVARAALRAP